MIRFYADENVEATIIRGLLNRGVDILTAVEDGYDHMDDDIILGRAVNWAELPFLVIRTSSAKQRDDKLMAGSLSEWCTPINAK